MATKKGVWEVLLDNWCKSTGKNNEEFFVSASPDKWAAQRWADHWNKHRVMHPTAEKFLLKEISHDKHKRQDATQASEDDSLC